MVRPVHIFDGEESKNRHIRTALYDDIWLSEWEIEILHTSCFQRLYEIKQLGWTDRLYPDAVHSRFNHSLGVLEQADRITRWSIYNLQRTGKKDLESLLVSNIDTIRITALLHDVFHIPFGHTLEDEIHFLSKRHDEDTERKIELLNRIVTEIVYWQYCKLFEPTTRSDQIWTAFKNGLNDNVFTIVKELFAKITKHKPELTNMIAHLAKAFDICLFMGNETIFKKTDGNGVVTYLPRESSKSTFAHKLLEQPIPIFDPTKEYFIIDIIGNTISADLLDYAKRDMHFVGLRATYDDRLLQFFTMSNHTKEFGIHGENDPKSFECPRLVINLFEKRIKFDALSEILNILNLRYLLTERVLFHRTKCSAGAMLGKVLQLLSPAEELKNRLLLSGDMNLLNYLEEKAEAMQNGTDTEISKQRAQGALSIIRALKARRFYKPVFEMKSIRGVDPKRDKDHPAKILSQQTARKNIEEKLEQAYGFQPGTVIIYCPEKTNLKEAGCLVIVDNGLTIRKVRDLKIQAGFETFGEEAVALENKYESLWNLYVFVPERLQFMGRALEKDFISEYEEQCKDSRMCSIAQDADMKAYLEQESDARDIRDIYKQFRDSQGLSTFQAIVKQEETRHKAQAERDFLQPLFSHSYKKRVIDALKERIKKS